MDGQTRAALGPAFSEGLLSSAQIRALSYIPRCLTLVPRRLPMAFFVAFFVRGVPCEPCSRRICLA